MRSPRTRTIKRGRSHGGPDRAIRSQDIGPIAPADEDRRKRGSHITNGTDTVPTRVPKNLEATLESCLEEGRSDRNTAVKKPFRRGSRRGAASARSTGSRTARCRCREPPSLRASQSGSSLGPSRTRTSHGFRVMASRTTSTSCGRVFDVMPLVSLATANRLRVSDSVGDPADVDGIETRGTAHPVLSVVQRGALPSEEGRDRRRVVRRPECMRWSPETGIVRVGIDHPVGAFARLHP